MRKSPAGLAFWIGLSIGLAPAAACRGDETEVVVFHAGSLSPLMDEMASRFEENHPGIRIRHEPSGSLDALRKITELGRHCDLVASADYRLIAEFLPADSIRELYSFLGNEMVLATGRSDLLSQPEQRQEWESDWLDKLFQGGYSYGISDPDRDPAGYYAHMVWKLAEIHYNRPGIYQRFTNRFKQEWMRPRSSELIALLQTGHLDFAFIYKSAALQNSLPFLSLPPEVSLADDGYTDRYRQAFLKVAGTRPDSRIEITGAPIRYGLARLSDSVEAQQFSSFLLRTEAQQVYRELGYTTVAPREISPLRTP